MLARGDLVLKIVNWSEFSFSLYICKLFFLYFALPNYQQNVKFKFLVMNYQIYRKLTSTEYEYVGCATNLDDACSCASCIVNSLVVFDNHSLVKTIVYEH